MKARAPRLTSPTTYRTLREVLLTHEPFLQNKIAEKAGASPASVHRLVTHLESLGNVRRQKDARYRVQEVASIVLSVLPFQRRMEAARAGRVQVRGSKEDVKRAVVDEGGVLCLESALEEYSSYFRGDRVAAYHPDPDRLLEGLAPHQGGNLPVDVYHVDLPLDGDVDEDRRTTKFRTTIDLACDGKAYAAKDLLQELWGLALD